MKWVFLGTSDYFSKIKYQRFSISAQPNNDKAPLTVAPEIQSPPQPVIVSTQRRQSEASDAIRIDQTLTFYVADDAETKKLPALTPIAD